MAEAGCTNQEIKAIIGHTTDSEVSRYTAAADQILMAEQALQRLIASTEQQQQMANQRKD